MKKKTHIARWDKTACGRRVKRSTLLSHYGTHVPFVMYKQEVRAEVVEATTCLQCIKSRYNA